MNVRAPTLADAPALAELLQALEREIVGNVETEVDDVRQELGELDLERCAWVVELDGRVAGFCSVRTRDELLADGYVHPDVFGRGVGSRLVELSEAAALEQGAPRLRNAVLGADERARALLESRGYRPVRHFYRMVIELDEPPPDPEWPAGLAVGTLDYPDEARAFHAALEEAFANEWDHEPETFEAWHERRIVKRPFDPTLWFSVKSGADLAAVAVCDAHRFGMGWVGAIGVLEPWRRRGLGLALLRHIFGEFHRRGEKTIGLGVDAENPTGATRLYERAGMRVAWSAVFYEKELQAAG